MTTIGDFHHSYGKSPKNPLLLSLFCHRAECTNWHLRFYDDLLRCGRLAPFGQLRCSRGWGTQTPEDWNSVGICSGQIWAHQTVQIEHLPPRRKQVQLWFLLFVIGHSALKPTLPGVPARQWTFPQFKASRFLWLHWNHWEMHKQVLPLCCALLVLKRTQFGTGNSCPVWLHQRISIYQWIPVSRTLCDQVRSGSFKTVSMQNQNLQKCSRRQTQGSAL